MRVSAAFALAALVLSPVQVRAQPACHPISSSVLEPLEGFWNVDWSYRRSPDNFLETTGTSAITSDLYGCVLTERFTAAIDTIPFAAITLFSAPSPTELHRVTVDSQHGGLIKHDGRVAGDTLVFEWQIELSNRTLRTRHIFVMSGRDQFTKEHYLSSAVGQPWELRQRAVYRRIKTTGH